MAPNIAASSGREHGIFLDFSLSLSTKCPLCYFLGISQAGPRLPFPSSPSYDLTPLPGAPPSPSAVTVTLHHATLLHPRLHATVRGNLPQRQSDPVTPRT